jgi:bifunctional non-homologous end joining protein LigD
VEGFIVSLEEYWAKRDFNRTPEPLGGVGSSGGNIFVVQEHHASSLHWDLRLERDGVLKSWAVPKGPPELKGVRRLAVQTEDHPLEYAGFEGEIPQGEYGGGTVSIWDRGEYETEKWREGEIIIHLEGGRLKGRYCMIELRGQSGNWLLFRCDRDEREG